MYLNGEAHEVRACANQQVFLPTELKQVMEVNYVDATCLQGIQSKEPLYMAVVLAQRFSVDELYE